MSEITTQAPQPIHHVRIKETPSKSSLEKSKRKSLSKVYDSNASLDTKRKQLKSRTRSFVGNSGLEEYIRLTSIIDDQKAVIEKYSEELKTLKIVSFFISS